MEVEVIADSDDGSCSVTVTLAMIIHLMVKMTSSSPPKKLDLPGTPGKASVPSIAKDRKPEKQPSRTDKLWTRFLHEC